MGLAEQLIVSLVKYIVGDEDSQGAGMTHDTRNPRIYSRLQIAAQLYRKVADRQLVETAGLTAPQLGVLTRVGAAKALNQTSLARDLRLNDSAITAMVRRLIGMGMLEKTRSESDSRAFVLKLTEQGQSAIDRAVNHPIAINRRIEQEFGAEALLQFTEKLNRIIALCDEESMVEAEG